MTSNCESIELHSRLPFLQTTEHHLAVTNRRPSKRQRRHLRFRSNCFQSNPSLPSTCQRSRCKTTDPRWTRWPPNSKQPSKGKRKKMKSFCTHRELPSPRGVKHRLSQPNHSENLPGVFLSCPQEFGERRDRKPAVAKPRQSRAARAASIGMPQGKPVIQQQRPSQVASPVLGSIKMGTCVGRERAGSLDAPIHRPRLMPLGGSGEVTLLRPIAPITTTSLGVVPVFTRPLKL